MLQTYLIIQPLSREYNASPLADIGPCVSDVDLFPK